MVLDPGETEAKIQALLARRASSTVRYGPVKGQRCNRGEHRTTGTQRRGPDMAWGRERGSQDASTESGRTNEFTGQYGLKAEHSGPRQQFQLHLT